MHGIYLITHVDGSRGVEFLPTVVFCCARLSWPSCQLLSARKSNVSYRISKTAAARITKLHTEMS